MINTQELRLGSWVLAYGYESHFLRVDEIHKHAVVCSEFGEMFTAEGVISCDDREIFPIQITIDILEKSGFIKDSNGFVLPDKMSLSISITRDGEYLPCWMDRPLFTGGTDKFKTIKYLHQLQNLYFFLTGEDLKWMPLTIKAHPTAE